MAWTERLRWTSSSDNSGGVTRKSTPCSPRVPASQLRHDPRVESRLRTLSCVYGGFQLLLLARLEAEEGEGDRSKDGLDVALFLFPYTTGFCLQWDSAGGGKPGSRRLAASTLSFSDILGHLAREDPASDASRLLKQTGTISSGCDLHSMPVLTLPPEGPAQITPNFLWTGKKQDR